MTKDPTSAVDTSGRSAFLLRSDETLGSFLRKHRQSQGKDLDEVAKKTRIHASTLRAIEEDNRKALPAEVFARGFVKNYAQYLGLDPNEALVWFIEQNNGEAKPTDKINVHDVLGGQAMAEAQTFPVKRFIGFLVVAGVLFLAGYLVFDFFNSSVPPADISTKNAVPQAPLVDQPPLPAPLAPGQSGAASGAGNVGAEPAPPLTAGEVKGSSPSLPGKAGQGEGAGKVEGGQGSGVGKKTEEIKPGSVPPAAKDKSGQNQESQATANPAPASAVPSTPAVVKAPGMNYLLEAKFTEKTWLSVQIDKERGKSFTYQPGDNAVWQAEKKISLFVGNAGGIVLSLNGKPVPALGKSMDSARVTFPAE